MSHKCDVLMISNLYPPHVIGGYEIAAYDIASCLRERGLRVIVLTSDHESSQIEEPDSSVIRSLRLSGFWGERVPLKPWEKKSIYNHNSLILTRLINELRPRLIYIWNITYLGLSVLEVIETSSVPALHHIMGYDLLNELRPSGNSFGRYLKDRFLGRPRITERLLPKNAIFISDYVLRQYRNGGITPLRSYVTHPGITCSDISVKHSYAYEHSTIKFVFLGQVTEHKGALRLVETLEAMAVAYAKKNFVLTLLGTASTDLIMKFSSYRNICIDYKGFQERASIYSELSSYDIAFFPSLWDEPFGIAQLELMAAGLPLCSSGQGGSSEPLIHGVNALIYDPFSTKSIRTTVDRIINSTSAYRANLGSNARKTVCDRFDKQNLADQVFSIITDTMLN